MRTTTLTILIAASLLGGQPAAATGTGMRDMQLVEGGTFRMGDVFDEGVRFASPVHEVTVSTFYINKYEVTVEEFAAFVKDSAYTTTAQKGATTVAKNDNDYNARLATPGAWALELDSDDRWCSEARWTNPNFEQTKQDPVTCVSWMDAIHYCNWLSERAGLAVAYDLETGDLLDAEGQPTTDVTRVRGFRLPTEAEWEFAARERGKKIRFGNGENIARCTQMNVDCREGEYEFAERGEFRGATVPVGSFTPNSLGLHDMSGNVWEWCSDFVEPYPADPVTNPYQRRGEMGQRRAARGGPWIGNAELARVAVRLGWTAEDRCNNIGFRLARSK